MTRLLTAAEMRAIETAAIASGEVTGLELMERAGRGVVEAILDWRPELATAPHRAVVLCGPGNNGGDGFVVARLLKERGWEVEVFLYGRDPAEIDRLPPDAAENARRWREVGEIEPLEPHTAPRRWRLGPTRPDIIIDALFGAGLARPLSGDLRDALYRLDDEIPEGLALRVAIDCPSGLCMDSGRVLGSKIFDDRLPSHLDLTVTFHKPKLGHYLAAGSEWAGEIRVVDIGLQQRHDGVPLADPHTVFLYKGSPEHWRSHKYDHGHALVLAGGVGKGGAARLAARGALRIGAGLVTVGCPPAALQENAAALDAIMLAALPDAEVLPELLTRRKVRAVCIGPGFGRGERLRAFVSAVFERGIAEQRAHAEQHGWKRRPRPGVVLDADAISEFADDPQTLFAMLHENCVLTPHQGEFGRLFPDLLEKLTAPATTGPAYSKVDATREAAARAGCVVLFKGPDTVIADPSGRVAVSAAAYERAAPWLATAGTGDVLAGFVTGLLARGFGAFEAAETASWLHVECARQFGPGLIAEDLPDELPAVFRALGL